MTDKLTPEQRSKNMRAIKGKNTKPEMKLRRALWSRGWRYKIHNKDIMGKPDIVFKKYNLIIFIDGCFWHKCPKCFKMPASNVEFWRNKINKNVERDKKVNKILVEEGWNVLRFWEHEIKKNFNEVVGKVENFIYLEEFKENSELF